MIHEFNKVIPVSTPCGTGIILYVKDTGQFENDEWCVIMKQGGKIRHFLSNQIHVLNNATYDITPEGMPVEVAPVVVAPAADPEPEHPLVQDSLHR